MLVTLIKYSKILIIKINIYFLLHNYFFLKSNNLIDFFNSKGNKNNALIIEFLPYHLECLPGFAKYFIDLGLNVDFIILESIKESLARFNPKDKIKIFEFKNQNEIEKYSKEFFEKLKSYKFVLFNTIEISLINFYSNIGIFKLNNSHYILHHTNEINSFPINKQMLNNSFFSLIDNKLISYLNPNYFGEFKLNYLKNKIVSFFIISTKQREYQNFFDSLLFLKNRNINFKINIVGRSMEFNKTSIPPKLKKYFKIYGNVKYQKLYNIVLKSNFIVMNLNPNSTIDKDYLYKRASGNVQLSYGFNKPLIIEKTFSKVYKFSEKDSIIYTFDNLNQAMLRASLMKNDDYVLMCKNILKLKNKIYNISLNNLKKILN